MGSCVTCAVRSLSLPPEVVVVVVFPELALHNQWEENLHGLCVALCRCLAGDFSKSLSVSLCLSLSLSLCLSLSLSLSRFIYYYLL